MAGIYRGSGGVNRQIKSQHRCLSGVNRTIKEQYRGLSGVNRKVFSSAPPGSAYFDGNGDYVYLADNEAWNFGSGDFCIEFWLIFLAASPTAAYHIAGQMSDTSNYWYIRKNDDPNTKWRFQIVASGVSQFNVMVGIDATNPQVNVPTHIALVRSGNTFTFYKDGVSVGSASSAITLNNLAGALSLGRNQVSTINFFNGKMSGVRITKGRPRYAANFTPPEYFTIDGADVGLCMRFAEPVGSTNFIDDTGKAVTTVGNVLIV